MALIEIFRGMAKSAESIQNNFVELDTNKEPKHNLSKGENLWSGSLAMDKGQIVKPSKTMDQCEHGWALVWADYRDSKVGAYSKVTYINRVVNGGQKINKGMANVIISADGYDKAAHKLLIWSNSQITGHGMNVAGDMQLYVLTDIVSF